MYLKHIQEADFELRVELGKAYFRYQNEEVSIIQKAIHEYEFQGDRNAHDKLYELLESRPELRVSKEDTPLIVDTGEHPEETLLGQEELEQARKSAMINRWLFPRDSYES